jgi:hypothetical protein
MIRDWKRAGIPCSEFTPEQEALLTAAGWKLIGHQPGLAPDVLGMILHTAEKDIRHPGGRPCRIEKLATGELFRVVAPLFNGAMVMTDQNGQPLLECILAAEQMAGTNGVLGAICSVMPPDVAAAFMRIIASKL